MPPVETLIAFALATAVFAYIPGPAMLYAAAQTLARGTRAGLLASLGLHIGGYVHVIAAAFGIAIFLEVVPQLYIALKLAGAAYLIWLGVQMIRTRTSGVAGDATTHATHGGTPARAFRQSVMVEMLNPKTALFFLAFLPQFSDPAASLPIWAQLLILGTIVNVVFSSADLVCVTLASRLQKVLARSNRATARARAVGGGILISLGIGVALDR